MLSAELARTACRSAILPLEFGTMLSTEVLSALRADHWLNAIPNRDTALRNSISRQIRDAFYFEVLWWKAAV